MTVLPTAFFKSVVAPVSHLVHPEPNRTAPLDAASEVRQTIRLTGLLTWTALSLHSLLIEPTRDHLPLENVLAWAALDLVFLAVFLFTLKQTSRLPLRATLGLLLTQTVILLLANHCLYASSMQAGLLILVAAQVSLLLPFRQALLWVVGQSVGLLGVMYLHWHNLDAWAFGTGYLCIQLLAVTSVRTAMREVRARKQLTLVVEELRATRELLSEASRQAERLHISRELHDVLGHHLTALGMNLQVGLHLLPQESPARPHLQTAKNVAQELLGDVRATVRGMRASASCDFAQEIQHLTHSAPITVHLHFSESFRVPCPVQSLVLRRCVQEILTNTVRHAQAQNLWLAFYRDVQNIKVQARDDGHGAPHLRFGCGLLGMRERLDSVGGRLHVDSPPGQGVCYQLSIPVKEAK